MLSSAQMLTAIADFHNVYEIATELSEYVADADAEISRKSIMAVGTIALELPVRAPLPNPRLGGRTSHVTWNPPTALHVLSAEACGLGTVLLGSLGSRISREKSLEFLCEGVVCCGLVVLECDTWNAMRSLFHTELQ